MENTLGHRIQKTMTYTTVFLNVGFLESCLPPPMDIYENLLSRYNSDRRPLTKTEFSDLLLKLITDGVKQEEIDLVNIERLFLQIF